MHAANKVSFLRLPGEILQRQNGNRNLVTPWRQEEINGGKKNNDDRHRDEQYVSEMFWLGRSHSRLGCCGTYFHLLSSSCLARSITIQVAKTFVEVCGIAKADPIGYFRGGSHIRHQQFAGLFQSDIADELANRLALK